MNKDNINRVVILVCIGILVFGGGFYAGKEATSNFGEGSSTADGINAREAYQEEFEPYWTVWDVLNEKFVEAASTTVQDRVWGSIEGLASSYGDPYTVFFPPREAKMFQENISGNFGGVGMEIGKKSGQLIVVSPLKGSPAERAGVKTGEAILTINGTSTADMSVDEAVSYIRGPQGTKVTITFLQMKEGAKPVERTITREVIQVPTLNTSVKPGGIFVVKLHNFTAQSPNLFRDALREFIKSGSNKLVIDLRGNPGGYLDAAWDIASWFLSAGQVVVTEDFGPNKQPMIFRSKGYDVFNENLRMILLVDAGSASASEIVAGALREHDKAMLVGTKTFGKGSVQELVPITPDTSLKVTIARWLTPKGHNLSHDGLEPDYKVEISDADIEAGRDPQMDKAVEILNQ